MKRTLFKVLFLLLALPACKSEDEGPTPTICICSGAPLSVRKDTSAIFFPAAFTPNGDGRNDMFRGTYPRGIIDSTYEFAVYNTEADLVHVQTKATPSWDGRNSEGVVIPGIYQYRIVFTTAGGQKVDTCGCIRLFYYNPLNSCLESGAKAFMFEDQMDLDGNYIYTSGESFCP